MKHQRASNLCLSPALRLFVSSPLGLRDLLAILPMSLVVFVIYWSPAIPDSTLVGSDYIQLHLRRMQFARDALFASEPMLPGWYPRELFGTPFWSNIQNFPFIPTRLLVLLTMDPSGPHAYANAIILSALLAAVFMYLYVRKIGLGMTASAAAGWTFACNGYYASRVAAGHLPLLEAYPGLPLLMWIIESLTQAQECGKPIHCWIGAAAISSTCLMLAGHPQLPVYAISAAALYSLWRSGLRRVFWAWGAMAVGVGVAAFALMPMLMLIGRSTRPLALAPAPNDLAMPYGRLIGFFLPWRDGAPPLLDPDALNRFHGYPNLAYFWDTVTYTGLLPWIALLLFFSFVARTKVDMVSMKITLFVVVSGVVGIVLSLPFVHQTTALIPGTILRSPARVIYLTEFALAFTLGAYVHLAIVTGRPRLVRVVVPLLLITHVIDLGIHDRRFILRGSLSVPETESKIISSALKKVGDGRVAIDYELTLPVNRTVDDVGYFDSIMLARPYQTILSLARAPRTQNTQNFNGSELSSRALALIGAKLLLTTAEREDLRSEGQVFGIKIYGVPSPSPRAEFFEMERIQYLSSDKIHAVLRDPAIDLRSVLLLPFEEAQTVPQVVARRDSPTVEYRRPDSDHIECTVTTGQSGYLRLIESWDPGWSATVDGSSAPVVPALDAFLAVPIAPGRHEVRFVYRTPGVAVGWTISIISMALLFGLIRMSAPPEQR